MSHVSFGRPRLLFPSAVQRKAVLGSAPGDIRHTCPSHLHLLFFICVAKDVASVLRCSSSLVMVLGQNTPRIFRRHHHPITISNINNSDALEDVQDFAYLGSKITTDGDSAKDATARIRKASQTFAMLKPIWKSKQLRLETKLRLYNSNVLSVLLYGSECWKLTAKLAHKLETFQNKCLRCSEIVLVKSIFQHVHAVYVHIWSWPVTFFVDQLAELHFVSADLTVSTSTSDHMCLHLMIDISCLVCI